MYWKFVIDPSGSGYAPGFDRDRVYEFKRIGSDKSGVYRLADQSPYFNVANLFYREPPSERILRSASPLSE